MQFEIAGERDPFLLIKLNKGETVYSEAGAMVSMGAALDLEGEIRGGLLGALGRKLVSGESLFTQKIVAARGAGEVLLAPSMPGDIQVLEVSPQCQYILNDGAFLAAETSVDLKMKVQGIGKSMFGGTGGFFVIQTAGYGKLAIGGFGSVFGLNVSPEEDIIIDNEHVVAWDARLNYDISVRTSKAQSLVGSLLNSVTSGEGFVNRFSGTGKVYVSSRNFVQMAGLLRAKLSTSENKSVL